MIPRGKVAKFIAEVRRQSAVLGDRGQRMAVCKVLAALEEELLADAPGGVSLDANVRLMVADLLADGWGYRLIAERLCLDANTVLAVQRMVREQQLIPHPDDHKLRANPDARKRSHRDDADV